MVPTWKATLKRTVIGFLWVIASFVGLLILAIGGLFLVFPSNTPPKEATFIKNFYMHRATYERLRDMLHADKQLLRVAGYGAETTKSIVARKPPEGDFPLERYNEYLRLLKQTGGIAAFRYREGDSVGVSLWGGGFGGDTRHVDLCWMDHEPVSQVASLDDFHRNGKKKYGDTPDGVFKHVDGNWYLWADW